jgi:hypothetical protein
MAESNDCRGVSVAGRGVGDDEPVGGAEEISAAGGKTFEAVGGVMFTG